MESEMLSQVCNVLGERMQREIWVKKVDSNGRRGSEGDKRDQAFRWQDGLMKRHRQNLIRVALGNALKVRECFNQKGRRRNASFSGRRVCFYVIYNLNPGKIWYSLVSGTL